MMLVVLMTALGLGIVLGCCCFETIGNEEELRSFFSRFFAALPQGASLRQFWYRSVLQTCLIAGILFAGGLSLFGIALIPFLVWYKGFASGFTAMVFFRLYGMKVIPFLCFGILPSAILWVPFLLFGALESCKTSIYLLERCCRDRYKKSFRLVFLRFCTASALSAAGILAAGASDVYLVPTLLKLIAGLYT